jgi:hypothetical protein
VIEFLTSDVLFKDKSYILQPFRNNWIQRPTSPLKMSWDNLHSAEYEFNNISYNLRLLRHMRDQGHLVKTQIWITAPPGINDELTGKPMMLWFYGPEHMSLCIPDLMEREALHSPAPRLDPSHIGRILWDNLTKQKKSHRVAWLRLLLLDKESTDSALEILTRHPKGILEAVDMGQGEKPVTMYMELPYFLTDDQTWLDQIDLLINTEWYNEFDRL